MRQGENLSCEYFDKQVLSIPVEIMGIYANEDDAIRRRNLHQREADENGFGNYHRYYVEPWSVNKSRT